MRNPPTLSLPPALATDLRVPAASPTAPGATSRLVSLDAYRGFVMLLMASAASEISQMIRKRHMEGGWLAAAGQLNHVEWRSCSLWDLIQPSFTFIVGVALPFSLAKRRAQGQSFAWLTFHAV